MTFGEFSSTLPAVDTRILSFPPVLPRDPRVLILGSMPGAESLRRSEYYAHPRNMFWPVMAAVLGEALPENYAARKELLKRHSIALWDVVGSCRRDGSLDQNIRDEELNDFNGFFSEFPHISHVFCNGTRAYQLFKNRIRPPVNVEVRRLPSTSPAHAVPFARKLDAWKAVAEACGG